MTVHTPSTTVTATQRQSTVSVNTTTHQRLIWNHVYHVVSATRVSPLINVSSVSLTANATLTLVNVGLVTPTSTDRRTQHVLDVGSMTRVWHQPTAATPSPTVHAQYRAISLSVCAWTATIRMSTALNALRGRSGMSVRRPLIVLRLLRTVCVVPCGVCVNVFLGSWRLPTTVNAFFDKSATRARLQSTVMTQ